MTLYEVALEMGMAHQSISQIEHKAIKKLRVLFAERDINYDDVEDYIKHLLKEDYYD
jgi:DNA-directed RNA polymerase sigma subunit (sigma70/sigma32)